MPNNLIVETATSSYQTPVEAPLVPIRLGLDYLFKRTHQPHASQSALSLDQLRQHVRSQHNISIETTHGPRFTRHIRASHRPTYEHLSNPSLLDVKPVPRPPL